LSKISDALVIEFGAGFDLTYLIRGVQKFELEYNEELAGFRKLMQAQQASEEKAEFERAQPTEAQVIEIVKRGMALG